MNESLRIRAEVDERASAVRVLRIIGDVVEQAAFVRDDELTSWIDELTRIRSEMNDV